MKIRIAIINLTGGGLGGGYYKYLRKMLPRIATNSNVEALLCISPETINMKAWFTNHDNVQFAYCKPFRFMRHSPDRVLRDHLSVFSPHVIFVPIARYFRYKDVPLVTKIRNMEPLTSPVRHSLLKERVRCWAQYLETWVAIKKSKRVIAISDYVRSFLIDKWHIPQGKISLVYFGAELESEGVGLKPVLLPSEFENGFLFTAGCIELYRGLEDAIMAMKHIKQQHGNRIKLVIAGKARPAMLYYQNMLKEMINKYELESNIYWAGNLTPEEMMWCYKYSSVFLMTSRVEACPNIALEALAMGCLCVVANNAPLPEFFGDAATYYAPGTGSNLAKAIEKVLSYSAEIRVEMKNKAQKRISQYSWDLCANKTVETLTSAAQRGL